MPQMVALIPARDDRRVAVSQQAPASKNSSRSFPASQLSPEGAFAGQASAQAEQAPHLEAVTGGPGSKGARVRTEASLRAEPNRSVTRRAFFPIHPRPAFVATVLCGRIVRRVRRSKSSVVVCRAEASKPRDSSRPAAFAASCSRRAFALSYSRK